MFVIKPDSIKISVPTSKVVWRRIGLVRSPFAPAFPNHRRERHVFRTGASSPRLLAGQDLLPVRRLGHSTFDVPVDRSVYEAEEILRGESGPEREEHDQGLDRPGGHGHDEEDNDLDNEGDRTAYDAVHVAVGYLPRQDSKCEPAPEQQAHDGEHRKQVQTVRDRWPSERIDANNSDQQEQDRETYCCYENSLSQFGSPGLQIVRLVHFARCGKRIASVVGL
ncbi:hypothetical protein PG984_005069 [Apiospora sp. TS-2023a]